MYKSNKLFGLNILIANFESFLWFGLIALLLYPIWVNKYFLTLDGPCHLYNASVLRDLWSNINTPFFLRFYDINHQIDPNWFSHIILAFLMMFLSPQLSEKIFLSSYVISFLLFFRWLILYINKENKFLAYIPFLFVYNHVFQMGFYNFSFSLLWMILTWLFFLKYIYKWPAYMFIPIGALILLLTYITHPAGYLITCATLLLLIFLKVLEEYSSFTDFLKALFGQFILVFAAMLPSLILLGYFRVLE